MKDSRPVTVTQTRVPVAYVPFRTLTDWQQVPETTTLGRLEVLSSVLQKTLQRFQRGYLFFYFSSITEEEAYYGPK